MSAEIYRFFSKIITPGNTIELRVVKSSRGTISGFFDDVDAFAKAAADLSGTCPAVYFTLNPVDAVATNRLIYGADRNTLTDDAKIARREWLLVDIDPTRPADCSSTDKEHADAIAKARKIADFLTFEGWPDPILADSGNGAHLLYRIDLPNDDDARTLCRGVLAGLAQRFDCPASSVDRKVFNASRICKVYGTLSQKGNSTEERPHRMSAVLECPDEIEIVPADRLRQIAIIEARPERHPEQIRMPVATISAAMPNKYALTALDNAQNRIASAAPGTRNDTLNTEAHGIAQLVGGGAISETLAWSVIESAAFQAGLDKQEIAATMRSAFEAGKAKPRTAPEPAPRFDPIIARAPANIDADTGEIIDYDQENEAEPQTDDDQASQAIPIDIFCVTQPPVMPLDVLPDCLVDYVADQSALLGCDHSIVGMSALVSAAACITDGIKLQPKRHDPTWKESARLWLAIVGDPSTRKSPAIAKAVRHVKRLDGIMADTNASEWGAYQLHLDEWKAANKDAKKDGGKPLSPPEAPKKRRLLVEDTTVEALSEVLKDNPRGILCLKDELTGWFASMDAYKGGAKGASMDRAHWLEAYNGGRRSIDRVTRGSISIPNWSVCMIGGIQEEMIRRVASSMGHDGLLQRFMVVCARPSVADADRCPDMRAMERYKELFDKLERLQADDVVVTMTEQAHKARERVSEYSRKIIAAADHPHLMAWLGKWDGLFARLALLYHVIDCTANSAFPTQVKVSGETAARVERLMCGFLLPHAIHFYTEIIDANDKTDHIRQLGRFILAKGFERITRRDMTLGWRSSRSLEDWEIHKITDSLAAHGWLAADTSALDTSGKPKAWFVNPAVHQIYADHAAKETARRRQIADTIRELKETYSQID